MAPDTLPSSLVAEWPIPTSVLLGSSVRAKGIERELRMRLPPVLRKCLAVRHGMCCLTMPDEERSDFESASALVLFTLERLATLPVFPKEAEDILGISARERLKWVSDGRMTSAGTRTVKLRGRAKAVTFHVFTPGHITDVLDADLPALWREDDRLAAIENRRRAAGKAALTRAGKGEAATGKRPGTRKVGRDPSPRLDGWDAFDADGLLR